MKINNRWFQLCVAVIAMVMIANLQYAWTLFVKPLQQGTGWKVSDIQWAFTLFILFQTWVQPAQGWLIDRMGPRLFATIAGVLCGIGWAGLGFVTSLPMLYTLYVLAGVGAYEGGERIDGRGKFLVPGFVDMHAHVTYLEWKTDGQGRSKGVFDRKTSEKTVSFWR